MFTFVSMLNASLQPSAVPPMVSLCLEQKQDEQHGQQQHCFHELDILFLSFMMKQESFKPDSDQE